MTKARLTTGLVVVAAAVAVGLSVFAVNQTGTPTQAAAAVTSSSEGSSSTAPVTTEASTAPSASSVPVTPEPTTTAPAPAATTPPTTVAPAPSTAAPAPAPSATYVVKPGDNLTVIAAWFELNGYGDLYEANKAVIGANPDLIFPGQTITLTAAGVTMGG